MSDQMRCPKGILMIYDKTTEQPVPFLITPRSRDIIWDTGHCGVIEENLINEHLSSVDNGDLQKYIPAPSFIFKWCGWLCHIQSTGYSVCTKKISIDDKFTLTNNTIKISGIQFPHQFSEEPTIQLTKQCGVYEKRIIDIFVSKITKVGETYTSFDLTLFPETIEPNTTISDFSETSINITITGIAVLT